ncbi:MAG: hypothetical protein ACRD03_00205 [Acidimicrobiales bacterium]
MRRRIVSSTLACEAAHRRAAKASPSRGSLGDRLAVIGELSADDFASLLNVVDGLVAKSRLWAVAGDLG